nr:heterogeneous nuclear ribonucleoprotein 1-like [Ipomoea batatas]
MMDKVSRRPRGFGFVTFADPEVANQVLQEEHVIDGRVVEVKRTVPREDTPFRRESKTKKIFVGGIPPTLTEGRCMAGVYIFFNICNLKHIVISKLVADCLQLTHLVCKLWFLLHGTLLINCLFLA